MSSRTDEATATPLTGTLQKESDHIKQLRCRYFVLSGKRLEYWASEADASAGRPPRMSATVTQVDDWWPPACWAGRSFCICARNCDGKRKHELRLIASSLEERVDWQIAVASALRADDDESTDASTHDELQRAWASWHAAESGGSRKASVDAYRSLLCRRPDCWHVWHDRGNFWQATGQPERADVDLSAALLLGRRKSGRHLAAALNDRAVVRLDKGDAAAALDDADEAVRLEPSFASALSNRGNVLRQLGRPREARDSYGEALALMTAASDEANGGGGRLESEEQRKLLAKLWHNRGVLHEELGNLVAAQLDLREATAADPSHKAAAASLLRVTEALKEQMASSASGDGATCGRELRLSEGAETQASELS